MKDWMKLVRQQLDILDTCGVTNFEGAALEELDDLMSDTPPLIQWRVEYDLV
jgi:hypothetical protein